MLLDHALAKINLTLDVLEKRSDGFHNLKMVMQSVSLFDGVKVESTENDHIFVESGLYFLPTGGQNLAAKAAHVFWEATKTTPHGLHITLEKAIPVCAGLAGGSSDAAAVLRLLNEEANHPFTPLELAILGEKVGSDVPFCVLGGTALAEGTGNLLTPLTPLPPCFIVLCKPKFPISTPALFSKIDQKIIKYRPDTKGMLQAIAQGDLQGVGHRLYNVFEEVLTQKQRQEVETIKDILLDCSALGSCMSGSGPTVFGLFSEESQALTAISLLEQHYSDVFLTTPV